MGLDLTIIWEIIAVVIAAFVISSLLSRFLSRQPPQSAPSDENDPVIIEFKKRKLRQKNANIAVAVVIVPVLWLRYHNPSSPLGCLLAKIFLGIVCVGAAAALRFTISNWRCPACDKYLGKRANPESCPDCGAKLR
jgi:hypothetical protein